METYFRQTKEPESIPISKKRRKRRKRKGGLILTVGP
jgi:hypothetical protein